MIYDKIVASDELTNLVQERSAAGSFEIVSTHIQEDQLARIPDQQKRVAVTTIPRKKVLTSGGVWGTSKWGESSWGDGTEAVRIADIFKGNPKDIPDALIAVTANQVDKIVTCDKRFRNRLMQVNSDIVWTFEEFVAFVKKQP